MKLATLRNGTQQGTLVVVSRDLQWAATARQIAPTMLEALRNWPAVEQALNDLSEELNEGGSPAFVQFLR